MGLNTGKGQIPEAAKQPKISSPFAHGRAMENHLTSYWERSRDLRTSVYCLKVQFPSSIPSSSHLIALKAGGESLPPSWSSGDTLLFQMTLLSEPPHPTMWANPVWAQLLFLRRRNTCASKKPLGRSKGSVFWLFLWELECFLQSLRSLMYNPEAASPALNWNKNWKRVTVNFYVSVCMCALEPPGKRFLTNPKLRGWTFDVGLLEMPAREGGNFDFIASRRKSSWNNCI